MITIHEKTEGLFAGEATYSASLGDAFHSMFNVFLQYYDSKVLECDDKTVLLRHGAELFKYSGTPDAMKCFVAAAKLYQEFMSQGSRALDEQLVTDFGPCATIALVASGVAEVPVYLDRFRQNKEPLDAIIHECCWVVERS